MAKIDELLETIDTLTVVELAELVKGIEEKYGVSAAAVAAPVAGAGAAAAGAATAAADTPYFSSIPLTNSASSATDKASMLSNNSSIFAILNFLLIYFLFSELFVLIFTAM